MKKILTILTLILLLSQVNAQIGNVSTSGSGSRSAVSIYNNSGSRISDFNLCQNCELAGHNSKFVYVIEWNKSNSEVLIYDSSGQQTRNSIPLGSEGMYVKSISNSEVIIGRGNSIFRYDIYGRRL